MVGREGEKCRRKQGPVKGWDFPSSLEFLVHPVLFSVMANFTFECLLHGSESNPASDKNGFSFAYLGRLPGMQKNICNFKKKHAYTPNKRSYKEAEYVRWRSCPDHTLWTCENFPTFALLAIPFGLQLDRHELRSVIFSLSVA